jgi:hypothetical protein
VAQNLYIENLLRRIEMMTLAALLVVLGGVVWYVLFLTEWEEDFYDLPDGNNIHTSLWDIIMTKKIPAEYPLKRLRQKVEELHILDEIEEGAEFFDDEFRYMLVADAMDIIYRGNGEVGGGVIHVTWHALDKDEEPCNQTEVSTVSVKINKYETENLLKSMEDEK